MEQDHKFMIEHPDNWPMWPHLPLVNRSPEFYEYDGLGYLLDSGPVNYRINGGIIVRLGNMYGVGRHGAIEYSSVDYMLAEGWRVN